MQDSSLSIPAASGSVFQPPAQTPTCFLLPLDEDGRLREFLTVAILNLGMSSAPATEYVDGPFMKPFYIANEFADARLVSGARIVVVTSTISDPAVEEAGGLTEASRRLAQAADLRGVATFLPSSAFSDNEEFEAALLGSIQWADLQHHSDALPAYRKFHALSMYDYGLPECAGTWRLPVETFLFDEKSKRSSPEPGILDIIGRPRYLVYGPYLWLPYGTWRVRAEIWVDQEASLRRFRIEWGESVQFDHLTFIPGRPGRYAIELEHTWTGAMTAELKIVLTEGALAGRIGIDVVDLTLVST